MKKALDEAEDNISNTRKMYDSAADDVSKLKKKLDTAKEQIDMRQDNNNQSNASFNPEIFK